MAAEVWKEEVQYINDTPMRIVVDDQISMARGILMPHWHEAVEIDCVLKGTVYYTVEGVTYRLEQGDIVVVGSGMIHSGRCSEGNTIEDTEAAVMTIQINKDVFHYSSYDDPDFEVFHPKENNAELLPVLMKIRAAFEQQLPYYEVLLNSCMLELCYQLLTQQSQQSGNTKVSNAGNSEIKEALKYIENHCREKLNLEEVAGLLKYNASYFSRRFHQYTGFTFVEYLNRCRTTAAANALLQSDKTISEIAMDCGFPNVSSFITFFKRQYKMTPDSYRKSAKK
ncbi:MAG: helix-turn-helix domain-containing protein [Oscillospiraceae bacterium]|nr:helix-turn-helix domain-containing protein [Oscillospiraceae bacterium]